MGKLPVKSQLMEDAPPAKKSDKKPMSPILQVMKAVTDHAVSPKKKAPKGKVKTGPHSTNNKKSKRKESDDSRSAEESGEVGSEE